ncbi:hypothetical protein F4604DRAFT_1922422 [Suillus subluteus]|nr:hypothetical protein F4604DRAFT_1922422 [Suillus subluteus]
MTLTASDRNDAAKVILFSADVSNSAMDNVLEDLFSGVTFSEDHTCTPGVRNLAYGRAAPDVDCAMNIMERAIPATEKEPDLRSINNNSPLLELPPGEPHASSEAANSFATKGTSGDADVYSSNADNKRASQDHMWLAYMLFLPNSGPPDVLPPLDPPILLLPPVPGSDELFETLTRC